MSETNKEIVTRFLKLLCAGNAEALKPLMTDDIEAFAMGSAQISGKRRYAEILAVANAFPLVTKSGLNPTILSLTAEGDRVAVEWEGNCTLANGVQYNNQYVMVFSLRDGRIFRMKEYFCTKLADDILVPLLFQHAR